MRTYRSFIFNLLGSTLPILVALVSVPLIARYAGVERLGALGIVWALVGYLGFLDFGLSRVVTRRVANAADQGRLVSELTELRGFFWWWMLPALVIMASTFMGARILLDAYLPSGRIGQEFRESWNWLAWSIPATLATNWLRGMLEGLHRFGRVSLLRIVFGSWHYAAPALAVLYWPTLQAMIVAIVLSRALSLAAHFLVCVHAERQILLGPTPLRRDGMQMIFAEGGWMTISNVVGSLMIYIDRFLLAAFQPARAVAWYVTSQEVMLRTLVIPGALAGVLFPQFSSVASSSVGSSYVTVYRQAVRIVAALMLPLCVLAAAGAYDGMRLWMGEEFALNSHRLVEIMAIGIFANSIAQLPFAWLQGTGHSRLTAQLHVAELPLYVIGLWACVAEWGVIGAAWMWTLRVVLDCGMLLILAGQRGAAVGSGALVAGISLIAVAGFLSGPEAGWEWRLSLVGAGSVLTFAYAWGGLLNREDRSSVLRLRSVF